MENRRKGKKRLVKKGTKGNCMKPGKKLTTEHTEEINTQEVRKQESEDRIQEAIPKMS
jgi:hypothetical protein